MTVTTATVEPDYPLNTDCNKQDVFKKQPHNKAECQPTLLVPGMNQKTYRYHKADISGQRLHLVTVIERRREVMRHDMFFPTATVVRRGKAYQYTLTRAPPEFKT